MSSPHAEILVSPVPALPPSPKPAMEDGHGVDEPMHDAHSIAGLEDEISRKSFKRKYRRFRL
jgi:hypothetical protein